MHEMGLADIDYNQSIPLTSHLTQIIPYNHPIHSSHESSSNNYVNHYISLNNPEVKVIELVSPPKVDLQGDNFVLSFSLQ